MHCWWECKLIEPLWRTVWRFLKKLGIKLPYDPEILLRGIYHEKTITEEDTCTPVFIAALFTIARAPRCPLTNEWIKKLWYIHAMEYYSTIKKNRYESSLVSWINLESVRQSEVSQKETNKFCILMHIYGIWKMVLMNLFARKEWRCRYRKWTFGCSGMNGESSIDIHTIMSKRNS